MSNENAYLELYAVDYDARLGVHCVTGRADYNWFLSATQGAEDNLRIQRQFIKGTKAYATLRADLKRGCVLPPLVLAANGVSEPADISQIDGLGGGADVVPGVLQTLSAVIKKVGPEDVYIIDGLQRTNALRQTYSELPKEEREQFLRRRLRFEMWINIPFGALAYRMLLLNAGQRPMGMKGQIEILSVRLKEDLQTIPNLTILASLEGQRRRQPGHFHLSLLAQGFQAWLQGSPHLDIRNLVLEQMLAETAVETLGASLQGEVGGLERDSFTKFVDWLVKLDYALSEKHPQFLNNETVLLGIAAAVGDAERSSYLNERLGTSLKELLKAAQDPDVSNPLAVTTFDELRRAIDPKKTNVGQATREIVFIAFQEFIRSEGKRAMDECWRFAASRA